jgi:5'-deoxynucleotidase YfbR-like HD superfamily hydrolase
MNIMQVLRSGKVMRYHNTQITDKQDMAQHQWEVAVILEHIYPKCSKELLMWALIHDAAEALTGDIPAPVKRASPELKYLLISLENDYFRNVLRILPPNISIEEKLALKYADYLSGMFFCHRRFVAGDKEAMPVLLKFSSYLKDMEYLSQEANDLLHELLRYD